MYVPSYQIHHVLNVYSKRLGQNRMLDRQKAPDRQTARDSISISAEGKRQAIIKKVAANIVESITRFGPQDEVDHEIVNQFQSEMEKKGKNNGEKENNFIYNVIDDINDKKVNTLSMKDSSFVMNQLEQIAQNAVNKNMGS